MACDGVAVSAYASFVSGTMVRLVEQLYKTEVPHFSEFKIIVRLLWWRLDNGQRLVLLLITVLAALE